MFNNSVSLLKGTSNSNALLDVDYSKYDEEKPPLEARHLSELLDSVQSPKELNFTDHSSLSDQLKKFMDHPDSTSTVRGEDLVDISMHRATRK